MQLDVTSGPMESTAFPVPLSCTLYAQSLGNIPFKYIWQASGRIYPVPGTADPPEVGPDKSIGSLVSATGNLAAGCENPKAMHDERKLPRRVLIASSPSS